MSDQFIPSGDHPFQQRASAFANNIGKDPSAYHLSQEEADALVAAAERFKDAYFKTTHRYSRSPAVTAEKKLARAEIERMVRKFAKIIRADDTISVQAKINLGLYAEPQRPKKAELTKLPPQLTFVRAHHGGNGAQPIHELRFRADDSTGKSKPEGAVRIELFVDLVPPDEAIPARPGENHGGRPWYLRSFTRSPIVIAPPMARVPMRVVYWARWADSTGNVGPFSATAAAWVEGGNVSRPALRLRRLNPNELPQPAIDAPTKERDAIYSVAVIEAHYLSFNTQEVQTEPPKLEATITPAARRIEDQSQVDAA